MQRTSKPLVVIAVLGTAVFATGTTAALAGPSLTDSAGRIHSCVRATTGAVRITSTSSCRSNERLLMWNQTGRTGRTGVRGATGARGLTGTTGPQGAPGAAGIPGAKGDTGSEGVIGPQGEGGVTGPQGVPGPQGTKGDTGLPGAGQIVFKSTDATARQVPTIPVEAEIGGNGSVTSVTFTATQTGLVQVLANAHLTYNGGASCTGLWVNPLFYLDGKSATGLNESIAASITGEGGEVSVPFASYLQPGSHTLTLQYTGSGGGMGGCSSAQSGQVTFDRVAYAVIQY